MSRMITCGIELALLCCCALAAAAPRPTPPPLDLLQDTHVTVAEGAYAGAPAPGRIRFVEVAALHGSAADEVTAVAPFDAAATLQPGQRYIFAYTERMRSPTQPRGWVRNPQGPTLLVKTGLEPALLPATAAMRGLLVAARDRDYIASRKHLRTVLDGLSSDDAVLQRLFAAELFGRTALRAQLKRSDQRRIRAFVRSPKADPRAREYLLSAAQIYHPQLGRWWRALAVDLLGAEAVSGRPNAANEVLVWTAFEVVTSEKLSPPLATCERWVSSGNGALAEQALLTLRRLAPAREAAALQRALAKPDLDAGTRAFLLDHQRRLPAASPQGG